VAGAFALRVAYAFGIAPDLQGLGDDAFYHSAALAIADGRGYVEGLLVTRPTAAHPPLYPLALSGIAWLGGRSVDAQRMVGVCAGTGTVLAIGLIATRLGGRRAGLAAAVVGALYPAFVAADGALMSETLFGLLVACALVQALRPLESPSVLGMALLGGLIGAAALTRSEGILLLVPALALALLAHSRRRALLATALVAAALIVVAPWLARNQHVFGKPVFTTNDGTTLAGANCHPTYYGDAIAGFTNACLPPFPFDANPADISGERREAALRYARAHADRAAVVAGLRVLRLWSFYGIDAQLRADGRDRGVQTAGVAMFYAVLLLGMAGGALLLVRGRRRQLAVMLSPVLVATVTAMLTYGMPRLRHIADVSLVALAGVAITAGARDPPPESAPASPPSAPPAAPRA
jgi:4-amino-4-deoxy-L-arabinose transferase-like glycosyltransferase